MYLGLHNRIPKTSNYNWKFKQQLLLLFRLKDDEEKMKKKLNILSKCSSGVTRAKSSMWPLTKKQQQQTHKTNSITHL